MNQFNISLVKWNVILVSILVVVFPVRNAEFSCKDPGDCDRKDCNDSFPIAPVECRDHVDEMNCFRTCKDPEELLSCFKEREANDTQEVCALKYTRSLITVIPPGQYGESYTHHLGIPCNLKCRVDPAFWACVQRCDNRGCYKSFEECETIEMDITDEATNVTTTGIACNSSVSDYISQTVCRDCVVDGLLNEVEEHVDCIVRYSTRASSALPGSDDSSKASAKLSQLPQCTYISGTSQGIYRNDTAAYVDVNFCIDDALQLQVGAHSQNRYATLNDVKDCYRTVLMARQLELCLSDSYTTACEGQDRLANKTCQDQCLHVLTKPYCYIPCPRNAGIMACSENCKIKNPTVKCTCDPNRDSFTDFMLDFTKRVEGYRIRSQLCALPNYTCYLNAIHHEVRPMIRGEVVYEWDAQVVRLRNCKSMRHKSAFVAELANFLNLSLYFDADDIELFGTHFTFWECYLTECRTRSESDAQHCMKSCVIKERSDQEMNLVCDGTGGSHSSGTQLAMLLQGKANYFRSEIVFWCMVLFDKNRLWSFNEYLDLTSDFRSYDALYYCEKNLREEIDMGISAEELEIIALATYKLERNWCDQCILAAEDKELFHPDFLRHAKCELDQCYKNKINETCKNLKSLETFVKAGVAIRCSWTMDFSLSPEPYKIWSTYFDEIPPHDETHNMVRPNTVKYLEKSSIGASLGHYVFPYFLVIRPVCDEGFYDDSIYKFIENGGSPVVQIKYYPTTSRQKYVDLMIAAFQGALVNMERKFPSDERYIPENPSNRYNETSKSFDGKTGCHLNLCYPAFLVPQVLLHIPIFEVVVGNQQTIDSAKAFAYTSSLHLRDISGHGNLKIADNVNPPTADEFFPIRKIQVYEDTQYVHLWARLPDSGYQGQDGPPGPELEHLEDHNCRRYPGHNRTVGSIDSNPHFPLDSEDFFQLQYSHGNAPQAIIAGFYDPNLVIIGDPDMRRHELVRWNFDVTGGSKETPTPNLFHSGYPCFSHHFKVRGYIKPMYSLFDRLDPDYWIEYYRMRYAPRNYKNVKEAKAIFSAITMEDRVIFVTTSGIVSFYQNFNNTAGLGKAWEVEAGDRLKKCFKIVRIAKRAHPKGDTIVAITYDYQVSEKRYDSKGKPIMNAEGKHTYVTSDISQQVWVGTYLGRSEPIRWQEITSGLTSENLKEERVFNIGSSDKVGYPADLPKQKLMGVPVERRETNPKSQIEAICYKTYRSNMGKAHYIELIEDQGWCDAIDATPVVAVDQKIQVLVRMKVYYSGGRKSYGKPKPRIVVMYVVASFNTDKSASQSSIWQIDSIIPRIPCQDEHRESIPSVVQFNLRYFRKGDPDTVADDYGCHSEEENRREENKIFLHGMTYTRSYNHHLFLYGNKLLQSTDGGNTFVQLNSFPEKGAEYECHESGLVYHRIKVMSFDDLGHYAFLTSKRELWYGNLGSLDQIRLRPSKSYSMITTRIREVPEVSEAVPFTVFFDSSNELVEMVAVVNENGTVSRIGRRSINERTILRARHFMGQLSELELERFEKLYAHVKVLGSASSSTTETRDFKDELFEDIKYEPLKWSEFCPFASPNFYHNFSFRHGRTQNFYFPVPKQHQQLGNVYLKPSLYTYQAVAFKLVWNSFFNYPYRSYSFADTDQFTIWSKKKDYAAVLGRLTYLHDDPLQHGILVSPDKYRRFRISDIDANRIFNTYFMDYGIVIKIEIEFSISNDFTLNRVDYLRHHLESILLNVDNANGSLIQINTEKEVLASKAAVRYVIILTIKKNTGLAQSYSGRDGIQVPIKLHLIGGFGTCIPTASGGIHGDSIATVIHVGCPPSLDLVFDWRSTLHSIQFRNMKAHFGQESQDCYQDESFCFFARYPLILHFHIFDSAKQQHYNFTGKYIMRIIGGGYSRDDLNYYTAEEQQAFNIPGVSDVSLIWNEWDRKFHQKMQRDRSYVYSSGRNDSREIVLQSGVSSIQWGCHTLSPCARITPRTGLQTVYYFKIFVSNRGVDSDTLCLFEKEFIILLYGFPPSSEIQLVTTVVFYLTIITTLYIAYFCLRAQKKLLKSTTLKIHGWLEVIKETLPKSWFKSMVEDDEETELEIQKRKDDIILSLQGHLNVPKLIPKKAVAITNQELVSQLNLPVLPTGSSFQSVNSSNESKLVIDADTDRPGTTTWNDLIYEQVISRRLASILERNRQKAEKMKASGYVEDK